MTDHTDENEQQIIEAKALRRAAHYFRDMAQENLPRRRVIEILDWMADEASPVIPPGPTGSS